MESFVNVIILIQRNKILSIPLLNYPGTIIMEEKENHNNIKPKTDRGRISILVIIRILTGIIIGAIISPYINDLFASKTPIYEKYTRYESEDTIVYKNEELQVIITFYKQYRWFEAENQNMQTGGQSKEELYDHILQHPDKIFDNQLKWFDYMCHNIII